METQLYKKYSYGAFCTIVLLFSVSSYSQNLGMNELQKFQQIVDGNKNGQGQQDPMQQPEVTQDKNGNPMSQQDMLLLEEEEKEVKREKPRSLVSRAEPKVLNNDLERFGYDLFSESPTTYAPATDIPISPNYILGPGDNIEIILFGKQSSEYSLQVNREGEIYFPSIGPISIAGLSFDEMKNVLNQRIKNQLIGVEASITLGILKINTSFCFRRGISTRNIHY